jgi:hypothetical protein
MKHQWEYIIPHLSFQQKRKCKICRAIQEETDIGTWMRIKRAWRPLVGRCPGKPYTDLELKDFQENGEWN